MLRILSEKKLFLLKVAVSIRTLKVIKNDLTPKTRYLEKINWFLKNKRELFRKLLTLD